MRHPSLPPRSSDPIHGAIQLDKAELSVIDHASVQRLRGSDTGFLICLFRSRTHAIIMGAMHLAGQAFDACFRDQPFSTRKQAQAYRHCVRLAALCHDLGHAPFSHAAEFAMPSLEALGLQIYSPTKVAKRMSERASHEDYTIGILTASSMAERIASSFDFEPVHVAALVSPDVGVQDDFSSIRV